MSTQISLRQISISKRFLWLLGACLIQFVYVPTSLWPRGGIAPRLPIDVFPVEPVWVVPYLLCFPLWLGTGLWAIWKMEDRLFRAFALACVFTLSIGVTTFIVFPTYVVHPALPGSDVFSNLLRYIYTVGGDYDALPSAHIYMTTLISLFYCYWYPRQRWVWLLVFVIVALSTLLTAQHYILDVITGALLGWLGYRVGLWGAEKYQSHP